MVINLIVIILEKKLKIVYILTIVLFLKQNDWAYFLQIKVFTYFLFILNLKISLVSVI